MVATTLVILVIVVVGVGVLAYRNRTDKGIESGISSFKRELHALAPRDRPSDPSGRPSDPTAERAPHDQSPESSSSSDADPPDNSDASGGDEDD